jgi:hypothetical protein
MAWAMLWVANGLEPRWVGPAELVRVRHYLRSRLPVDWPRLLRRRAQDHSVRMLPAEINRLIQRPGVSSGGITAAQRYDSEILPSGDEAEFYMAPETFDMLRVEGRMTLTPMGRSNVVLRVPSLGRPELLAEPMMPIAVVAVDLLDTGVERSIRAGSRLLRRLRIQSA